jgi:amino acid transporter
MAGQKKFGTFSGVLTPSLLTILGVIMYMRLGSVVGNATGIFQVILIIVFAHLISITTGLSVSSIATDKKIDKGGIYYMLTRSLGLPIGGAIGLTIFIATAFSIALYLIGFSESIIPVINEDWATGGISTNKLRLFGSLALLVVLIVAYISTNFALKIQYVILGLIVLSLGSIFLGSSKGLKVGSDILESPSFATLFGLFFPAVTGFTAGVAMSGDLKNPKISIPWGTMLSISIGLSVYLILSVFIYYNIDSQFLKTNNNVLIEFGAVPFLVLCGVWGATLSSALGGILGGPRILQAMSLDNITPKFFAKESGSNKEPRNALFLTFFIAEIGILIGELNVIAELVAMFYMAAYLFINLSCFLEQWSSPDFRPKFKIPLWISLLGSIATLLLMIQLNLGATLVAVLFMLIFWFWLSKKDLVLGTGDVWLSVWNSVVKTGLKNIQKKTIHKRNWQPNILLFSGNTSNRPHLIEFGKNIIGRTGMVSNFDLIETKSAKVLFPKADQNLKDDLIKDDSIFHRKLYCQNIFKGIETIATTYGFSGVEPNTVLMGWAKNTKNPIWFGEMTQKLKDLDYNILYLDYDLKKGFGNYNKIDLWWTAFDKENELSLQLIKFLRSSARWKKASLNIYYVNSEKSNSKDIISRMKRIGD